MVPSRRRLKPQRVQEPLVQQCLSVGGHQRSAEATSSTERPALKVSLVFKNKLR